MAFTLFRRGAAIAEVARQTQRTASTIEGYLADYITAERPASISPWVPEAVQKRVIAALKEVGGTRLKPILVALNESVSYDHIRIVIAHHQPPR